jgi:hypothetical protein
MAGANIVVGQLLDTVVSEVQSNGRIARLTIDPVIVARTQVRLTAAAGTSRNLANLCLIAQLF